MKFAIKRSTARRSASSSRFITVKGNAHYFKQIAVTKHTPAYKALVKRKGGILTDVGSILEFLPMHGLDLREVHPFSDDKDALCSDWHRVGNDMWHALHKMTRASDECEAS